MQLKIKTTDFLDTVRKLEKMAPLGRGKKAYLEGSISISCAQNYAIFTCSFTAKQVCPAEGFWDAHVFFPFEIARSFLKVPPKNEYMEITCINKKIKIEGLTTSANVVYL